MTAGTGAGRLSMVHCHSGPGRRYVAGITGCGRRDMIRRFTINRRSVVAIEARAGCQAMIIGRINPYGRSVAIFTVVVSGNMTACLAQGRATIVTAKTGLCYRAVIKKSRWPADRRVTGGTDITADEMIPWLANSQTAIVATRAVSRGRQTMVHPDL